MKALHRCWHAFFGHKNLNVDLTREPWTATCSCGFSLRVKEFSVGKIGG